MARRSCCASQSARPPSGASARSSWRKSAPLMDHSAWLSMDLPIGPLSRQSGCVTSTLPLDTPPSGPPRPGGAALSSVAAGAVAMALVGSSVGISRVLVAAPLLTAQALRYGLAWAAVALACEASFTLLAVPVLGRHGAWGVSVHSVWIGAVMLTVLGVVTEGPTAAGRLTAAELAAVAYLAILVTVVAFVLWY